MTTTDYSDEDDRPMGRSIRRGLMCHCPNCGKGALLRGYARVRDTCPACGENFHHHRADDGPAYLTILVVGHLMAPALMATYFAYEPTPLTMITLFGISCTVLSLFLLPRFKGMIVAIQWSRRMHGFGSGEILHD